MTNLQQERTNKNRSQQKKEYINIPILIEQTPAHIAEKLISYDIPKSSLHQCIKDFLVRLQQAVKTPENQAFNLYCLYHNYFAKITQVHKGLSHTGYPKPNVIQQEFQIQFNLSAQTLYLQLITRSRFDKLKDFDKKETDNFLNIVEQSWQNYDSIFQHEKTRINFHPIIVWELFESFLHQFSQYNFRIDNLPRDKLNEECFSIKDTKKMLKKLVEGIPKEFNKNATTKDLFAYYALLTLATIQVYQGNFEEALQLTSRISLDQILIYSKSFSALLHLFLITSYSHFMIQEYNKSARLAQMFLLFYQRNKKHLTNIQWLLMRQFERIAVILCLSYIFLQEQPKSLMMEVFKNTTVTFKLKDNKREKQRILDKYYKLKQNDHSTFSKLFNHCCLPVIGLNRTLQQHHKLVFNRFQKLQSITLNSILQHYTQIPLEKISKLLNISETELKQQLSQNSKTLESNTPWDKTVMVPLLSQKKVANVEITSDNIVKIYEFEKKDNDNLEDDEWQQHRQEVEWLKEKVEAL